MYPRSIGILLKIDIHALREVISIFITGSL
jgi:hypothetical protein